MSRRLLLSCSPRHIGDSPGFRGDTKTIPRPRTQRLPARGAERRSCFRLRTSLSASHSAVSLTSPDRGPRISSTWHDGPWPIRGESIRLIPSWRSGLFVLDAAGEVLRPGPDARLASTTFDAWLTKQSRNRAFQRVMVQTSCRKKMERALAEALHDPPKCRYFDACWICQSRDPH
jgi:hypothetical protein